MTPLSKYLLLLLLSCSALANAQESKVIANETDNQEVIEALVLYPDNIRNAILETSLHPELLVRLGTLQTQSKEAFHQLVQYLPEDEQKKYWELSRYPGLINKLVEEGQKSKKEIEPLLQEYPQEVHPIAVDYGVSRYRTLAQMSEIEKQVNKSIEQLLSRYEPNTKANIQLLLKYPEVLQIMIDHIDLVVLVGDYYRQDAAKLLTKADSMREVQLERQAQETEAWRKGLEDDPMALKEFEEVSKGFKSEVEEEVNYDPMYPDAIAPEKEVKEKHTASPETIVVYNYYPYPFWYGYPAWFPNVYWYQYPYWYHWGYYYEAGNAIIVYSLPSYYYFYWYFQYPSYFYRYPYLSDYIIRYYRARRGAGPSRSSLTRSVDNWSASSRSRIPSSILDETDDRVRREKLREYGRFEEDYRKRAQKKPEVTGTREEYLNKNSSRYQYLSGQTRTVKESNLTTRTRTSQPQPTIRTRPLSRSVELERARETHQRTWQQSNYNRSRQVTPPIRLKTPTGPRKKRKDN